MTKFRISNVKTLTSLSSHGGMDFRVKETATCAAPAQIVRDFVPVGRGRTLGFSVVVTKTAPISRRHNVLPYRWREVTAKKELVLLMNTVALFMIAGI